MSRSGYQLLGSRDDLDSALTHTRQPRKFSARRICGVVAVTAMVALGIHYCRRNLGIFQATTNSDSSSTQFLRKCPSNLPLLASPPAAVNLWAPLSSQEIKDVQAWVEEPVRGFNLTEGNSAEPSDNVISNIEAFHPPKHDALVYLDSQDVLRGNKGKYGAVAVTPPHRLAKVTIEHGGLVNPVVRDYVVGPLPTSQETTIRRLTEIYHRDDIPHNSRGLTNMASLIGALPKVVAPIVDTIQDLFGGTVKGDLETDTFVPGASGPWSYDGSFRRTWMSWRLNTAGSFLLPINFYQYIDLSGTDSSLWKILKVVYHNQTFSSLSSFLDAYANNTLIRHPPPDTTKKATSWTQRTRTSNRATDRTPGDVADSRDLDHLPGPRTVSFAGLRFRVDRERQYISWMGWGLYLGFNRDVGLSLWDVRFKGERIIYQLSLQEAMIQYAGNDPVQSTTAWLDSYFGIGLLTRDLLPNYDCPHESVFLPSATLFLSLFGRSGLAGVRRERAICVFEQDVGRPLTRHFGEHEGESGAVKAYVLVVRSIATVGNYDYSAYSFDYIFHLDGTIEVKASASGYLQGGYWTAEQDPYGARIRDRSMGNVHDHIFNFKVDLDVAGLNNTFLKTTSHKEEIQVPWLSSDSDEKDWPGDNTIIQQRIEREYITSESHSRVKLPANLEGSFAIVNQAERNAWGSPRGYAIHPGSSMVHNTILGSKYLEKNANWVRDNLAVSLRKDTEPASSSMWNLHLPGAPPVDFDRFFDGEDIEQRDLVLWVNIGMHHLPQAEDSPNTKTNVATSSFMLTPLNYFDSDPSTDLMNAITLNPGSSSEGDNLAFNDNGVEQHFHCVPSAPTPFSYARDDPAARVAAGLWG